MIMSHEQMMMKNEKQCQKCKNELSNGANDIDCCVMKKKNKKMLGSDEMMYMEDE